jgi:uncharacterized protein YggT (Ycf19 family)
MQRDHEHRGRFAGDDDRIDRIDRGGDHDGSVQSRGATEEATVWRNAPDTEPRARQIEPNRIEVERRDETDRRVVDEPVDTDRRVAQRRAEAQREAELRSQAARERRLHVVGRVTQGVDYLFLLLYGLLGIRFVLSLLGASETAGFVQFITGLTQPFYGPFTGIVARPAINGGFLDFPLLIALLAYALLHLAVRGLLRLIAGMRTAP